MFIFGFCEMGNGWPKYFRHAGNNEGERSEYASVEGSEVTKHGIICISATANALLTMLILRRVTTFLVMQCSSTAKTPHSVKLSVQYRSRHPIKWPSAGVHALVGLEV